MNVNKKKWLLLVQTLVKQVPRWTEVACSILSYHQSETNWMGLLEDCNSHSYLNSSRISYKP